MEPVHCHLEVACSETASDTIKKSPSVVCFKRSIKDWKGENCTSHAKTVVRLNTSINPSANSKLM